MSAEITVVDYGLGNLGSVRNMLRWIGIEHDLATSEREVAKAARLLLPGVGAFDRGMELMSRRGLVEPLRLAARKGTPILGVCLGMQLLTNGSEEGSLGGLGIIDAMCVRITGKPDLRIPHMGWNRVDFVTRHKAVAAVEAPARFYFAHSYHVVPTDTAHLLATTTYGDKIVSMVCADNVLGAQFHPEKSHAYGMQLLSGFATVD